MPFSNLKNKFLSLSDNLKGTVFLLIAAGLFSISVLLIKIVGQDLHVTQVVLFRQIVMAAIVAPAIIKGFPGILKTNSPFLQFVRIFFALGALLFGFTAFINLPLADATAFGFAKSFFVSIFAILILKEVVGVRRWAATIIGFIGVLIMLQPGTDSFSIFSIYAVLGAACAGFVMVLIRLMTRTDDPKTILAWQAVGVGLIMIIPAIYYWQTPTPLQWLLLLGVGVSSYLAQLFNIYAYKNGEASLMASLDYARLIYATIFGFIIFGDLPTLTTWIGAGIVVAAAIYTVWREAAKKKTLTRTHEGRIL